MHRVLIQRAARLDRHDLRRLAADHDLIVRPGRATEVRRGEPHFPIPLLDQPRDLARAVLPHPHLDRLALHRRRALQCGHAVAAVRDPLIRDGHTLRADLPSDREPSTRRSKPRGSGRRPPSSLPNMPGGLGARARTRRVSDTVGCAGLGTAGWPRPLSSTSSPRWPSMWRGWASSGWARPRPTPAVRPLPPCGGLWPQLDIHPVTPETPRRSASAIGRPGCSPGSSRSHDELRDMVEVAWAVSVWPHQTRDRVSRVPPAVGGGRSRQHVPR